MSMKSHSYIGQLIILVVLIIPFAITGAIHSIKQKKEEKRKEVKVNKNISPEQLKYQYELCVKLVKEVLAKYNNPKGFTAGCDDEDQLEEFYNGEKYTITICNWDAWDGTNNRARDEQCYQQFLELLYKIETDIRKTVKNNKELSGTIYNDGDWDGGDLSYDPYVTY